MGVLKTVATLAPNMLAMCLTDLDVSTQKRQDDIVGVSYMFQA